MWLRVVSTRGGSFLAVPAQPAMGTQRAATNSGDAGSTNSGTRGGSFLADPAQPAMGDNARPEHISARRALRW